jgi:hypothetical protein
MLDFKNISVGDLLIQQVPNPLNIDTIINRRGIIIDISNNISTIEWMPDGESYLQQYKKTTIMNSSLRKMIMSGHIQHYSVSK